MLGSKNSDVHQSFDWNQLQLFCDGPEESIVEPINFLGDKKNAAATYQFNKRCHETENFEAHQRLKLSLDSEIFHDKNQSARCPSHGKAIDLRLSISNDFHHEFVRSRCHAKMVPPSTMLSLKPDITAELDFLEEDISNHVEIQAEEVSRMMDDLGQKHAAYLFSSIEKGLSKMLQQLDTETETVNHENNLLMEKMQWAMLDYKKWQDKALCSEYFITDLRSFQLALPQLAKPCAERYGEGTVNDAASCNAGDKSLAQGIVEQLICTRCNVNQVSKSLMMPCKHLCLCQDCDLLVGFCPTCHLIKISSMKVGCVSPPRLSC